MKTVVLKVGEEEYEVLAAAAASDLRSVPMQVLWYVREGLRGSEGATNRLEQYNKAFGEVVSPPSSVFYEEPVEDSTSSPTSGGSSSQVTPGIMLSGGVRAVNK